MTAKSDYLENAVLNHVLRVSAMTVPTNIYVALYTDATTDAGGGTEVAGGSYARQTSTWATAASGATSNSAAITFANMPACVVTHVGLRDAITAGNLLYHGVLATPQTLMVGQNFAFAIGALGITEA